MFSLSRRRFQMEEQLRNKRRLADPEYQTLLSTIVKHILDSAIDKVRSFVSVDEVLILPPCS